MIDLHTYLITPSLLLMIYRHLPLTLTFTQAIRITWKLKPPTYNPERISWAMLLNVIDLAEEVPFKP